MRKKYFAQDWIGKKLNRLTILEADKTVKNKEKVIAECECGVIRSYTLQNLITNNTRSCGCWNLNRIVTHGCKSHPLYDVWKNMIDRCYNNENVHYDDYGQRGVTVCDEWRNDVKSFVNWAINNGWKNGLFLDKDKLAINNRGLCYCPEYCCFLTRKENARYKRNNRVIEYNGLSLCMAEWSEKFNINYDAMKGRLNRGWSMEKIINTPTDIYHNRKKIA